jgi:hypothetical protein
MSIDYMRHPLQFEAIGQDTDGKEYTLGNFKVDIDTAQAGSGYMKQVYVLRSLDNPMQDINVTERQFDIMSRMVEIKIKHRPKPGEAANEPVE